MPITLEDDSRLSRRCAPRAKAATKGPCEPVPGRLTAALPVSLFEALQEDVGQLQQLDAWLRHLRGQVHLAVVACQVGTLPSDPLSGVALVKLERDVLTVERQIHAVAQSNAHRLACVRGGRQLLSCRDPNG